MKRSTYLLAAPLLALSLAACGGADETTETPQATEDAAAEEQAAEPTEETEESTPEDEADAETSEDESTEAAEEEESTDEAASEDNGGEADGSRENPYAVGDTIPLTDWEVVVNSVTLDGTDEVMSENEFNEPPADGRQFVLVNLDATYTGEETGTFWIDLTTKVLGSEGNTFGSGEDDYCGSIPQDLTNASEQFPDATETGNICVSVPTEQLDGALLLLEESFSFEDSRVFVALD